MIQKLEPAAKFFRAIDNSYSLFHQHKTHKDYVSVGMWNSYGGEFFFTMESMLRLPLTTDYVGEDVVYLKSVWVPNHHRRSGVFLEHLKIITEMAEMFGTAIITCCNPFDLAVVDETNTLEELRETFKEEIGFYYVQDGYLEKKFRQRERFKSVGFRQTNIGPIQDRKRIKKKDQLAFIPESMPNQKLFRHMRAIL